MTKNIGIDLEIAVSKLNYQTILKKGKTLRKSSIDNSVRSISKDDHLHDRKPPLLQKRDILNQTRKTKKNIATKKPSERNKEIIENIVGESFRLVK